MQQSWIKGATAGPRHAVLAPCAHGRVAVSARGPSIDLTFMPRRRGPRCLQGTPASKKLRARSRLLNSRLLFFYCSPAASPVHPVGHKQSSGTTTNDEQQTNTGNGNLTKNKNEVRGTPLRPRALASTQPPPPVAGAKEVAAFTKCRLNTRDEVKSASQAKGHDFLRQGPPGSQDFRNFPSGREIGCNDRRTFVPLRLRGQYQLQLTTTGFSSGETLRTL